MQFPASAENLKTLLSPSNDSEMIKFNGMIHNSNAFQVLGRLRALEPLLEVSLNDKRNQNDTPMTADENWLDVPEEREDGYNVEMTIDLGIYGLDHGSELSLNEDTFNGIPIVNSGKIEDIPCGSSICEIEPLLSCTPGPIITEIETPASSFSVGMKRKRQQTE